MPANANASANAARRATATNAAGLLSSHSAWPAALVWAAGAVAMLLLDGRLDLANLALLLMLTSALASLWMSGWATALASVGAVAAFNWTFVPPRQAFSVDLHQHAVLLGTMLVVNWTLSALMISQRRSVQQARRHAERETRLRAWGDTLRDAADPALHAGQLQQLLADAAGVAAAVQVRTDDDAPVLTVGSIDAEQQAGLAACMRQHQAFGPGSGRHEEQPDCYLPLRGRGAALGAALLHGPLPAQLRRGDAASGHASPFADLHAHLQALCDQFGQALQRAASAGQERAAQQQAQDQATRNALLAAISHDYRTPLATIMGAASSLADQAERLSAEQRHALATGIVQEAQRLNRLTDNTLQLARLGAPGVALRCDWEAAEEIVGAVLQRVRRHDPARRVRARLEPGLPLLWCDAILVAQLLENLVDNALKYSPDDAPVELLVRHAGDHLLLAVRDRGPGVPRALRERVFGLFERGVQDLGDAQAGPAARPGSGVGLAVCRAIAVAHGGTLQLRARGRGGSSFECSLPAMAVPPLTPLPPA